MREYKSRFKFKLNNTNSDSNEHFYEMTVLFLKSISATLNSSNSAKESFICSG